MEGLPLGFLKAYDLSLRFFYFFLYFHFWWHAHELLISNQHKNVFVPWLIDWFGRQINREGQWRKNKKRRNRILHPVFTPIWSKELMLDQAEVSSQKLYPSLSHGFQDPGIWIIFYTQGGSWVKTGAARTWTSTLMSDAVVASGSLTVPQLGFLNLLKIVKHPCTFHTLPQGGICTRFSYTFKAVLLFIYEIELAYFFS